MIILFEISNQSLKFFYKLIFSVMKKLLIFYNLTQNFYIIVNLNILIFYYEKYSNYLEM